MTSMSSFWIFDILSLKTYRPSNLDLFERQKTFALPFLFFPMASRSLRVNYNFLHCENDIYIPTLGFHSFKLRN